MVNPGDFYPFIRFCEKQLPLNAEFDFRIQLVYGDIKAKYYLYPRKFKKDAEYLIVYDQEPPKGYSPWQTFRPGALILKRGKA
jgi:hypothetical protein